MKVLMFGWEFPPFNTGGLGTACYGLTKALSKQGINITFVIPTAPRPIKSDFVNLIVAACTGFLDIKRISSLLVPYISSKGYDNMYRQRSIKSDKNFGLIYGQNLFDEVKRYAMKAREIAENESFDLIHCHDWMTYLAGIEAKKISKKPLIVQVHATEFDRTGGHPNQAVYDIERMGMHAADLIIAVSNFTKNKIVEHYGISHEKVFVVHNAVEFTSFPDKEDFRIKSQDKIVLFLGRITLQKGPDYFIDAAKKVLENEKNIKFIIAGSGDMEADMIEKVARLGIAKHVLFTGFLRGDDIDRAYKMADLYVMPSVSEPFGITPLEAMRNGTPVIISKQSGVSEVIKNCLKVDFWDIDEMANKIIAVLNYNALHHCLKEHGLIEIKKISWNDSAKKCINVYERVLSKS